MQPSERPNVGDMVVTLKKEAKFNPAHIIKKKVDILDDLNENK